MKTLFLVGVMFLLASLYLSSGCDNRQGVKIGDNPPGISENDINGEYISLSKLKGKVVVIYFWTNSCCGDNLKKLELLYDRNKDKGLEILAVNVGDSKEVVRSYANILTFTMLTDEYSMLFKQYRVSGFPTMFILDKNGIIREKILGDIPTEKLQSLIVKQFTNQKEAAANYEKIHSR